MRNALLRSATVTIRRAALLGLVAIVAAGQEPGPIPLAFEVASVKRNTEQQPLTKRSLNGNKLVYKALRLEYLITEAYAISFRQLKGPAWLRSELYDIAALLPKGATEKDVPALLRRFLAERFHVKVHWEPIQTSVYALTIAPGGLKINAAPPPDAAQASGAAPRVPGTMAGSRIVIDGQLTLKALTNLLTIVMRELVLDMTNTTGEYEIKLDGETAPSIDDERPLAPLRLPDGRVLPETAPSIFIAIQRLGLRLDSRRLPVDYLVVDAADKIPTDN